MRFAFFYLMEKEDSSVEWTQQQTSVWHVWRVECSVEHCKCILYVRTAVHSKAVHTHTHTHCTCSEENGGRICVHFATNRRAVFPSRRRRFGVQKVFFLIFLPLGEVVRAVCVCVFHIIIRFVKEKKKQVTKGKKNLPKKSRNTWQVGGSSVFSIQPAARMQHTMCVGVSQSVCFGCFPNTQRFFSHSPIKRGIRTWRTFFLSPTVCSIELCRWLVTHTRTSFTQHVSPAYLIWLHQKK